MCDNIRFQVNHFAVCPFSSRLTHSLPLRASYFLASDSRLSDCPLNHRLFEETSEILRRHNQRSLVPAVDAASSQKQKQLTRPTCGDEMLLSRVSHYDRHYLICPFTKSYPQ